MVNIGAKVEKKLYGKSGSRSGQNQLLMRVLDGLWGGGEGVSQRSVRATGRGKPEGGSVDLATM